MRKRGFAIPGKKRPVEGIADLDLVDDPVCCRSVHNQDTSVHENRTRTETETLVHSVTEKVKESFPNFRSRVSLHGFIAPVGSFATFWGKMS
jgi:hypothetical protein